MIMASPFNSMGKDKKVIDFNYPQDVSKEALADLDKALKSGNGQLTVDALVRYSIAESGISQDNMPDIVKRIEQVIAKEKQPHIKALLYYFEALVYQGYRNRYARWSDRNNPVEEVPADVSEWDRQQFDKKITELIEKSLAEPEALKAVAVTSLPDIIECNELGATYVPTLHEFMLMKGMEKLQSMSDDNEDLLERIKADWLATTQDNVPAQIFALVSTGQKDLKAEYERYRDNEHCGYLLPHLSFDDNKQRYGELKSYLQRFPNSIYTAQVNNMIIGMEQKELHVNYPNIVSSRDKITVTASVNNANSYWLIVYRVDEMDLYSGRIDPDRLHFVSETPVTVQGIVPFNVEDVKTELPPLPYGCYVIIPKLDRDEKPNLNIYGSQLLRVTDIGHFAVTRIDHHDIIAAVDINTGMPLQGVTVNCIRQKKNLGETGKDGILKLDFMDNDDDNLITKTIKGDDRYGPTTPLSRIVNRYYNNITARFYSDLGVYRPGETIQWAINVYDVTNDENTPREDEVFWVRFSDSNGKEIDLTKVVSDEYGRIEGSFVVPKDRMNGRFQIQLGRSYRNGRILAPIDSWGVNVRLCRWPARQGNR